MKIKQYSVKADVSEEGQLEAVFSVFDVVDSDGDVVKSTAIPDGQELPLVWAHNWEMPIGKGVISNTGKEAIFKGHFFLDTDWGRNAYNTVKGMGTLQEYSWGFKVLEEEKGSSGGRAVNNITKTEPFEVSPVLVGANRETYTIAVKAAERARAKVYVDASVDGSYESLRDELNAAFRDRQFGESMSYGYSYVVATFDNRFIALMWQWDDEEDSYWEVSYSRSDSGELLLGEPKQVTPETSFVPVNGQAMSYEQHSDYVQAAVSELLRRSKYLVDAYKSGNGKGISEARIKRMTAINKWLNDGVTETYHLLEQSKAFPDTESKEDARALYAQFLRIEAQQIAGVK